jgi:hypothetical protein
MSPDYHFSWHVLTKTELSSTQLALPIKCQKNISNVIFARDDGSA